MPRKLTVVYDACVLYPNYLRDLLIQLATADLFQARWTNQIHDEWIRNLLKNRPELTAKKLDRLKQTINRAVPDCLVTDFEELIPGLSLPDPNDRHILAAAIAAKADRIVTFNLKDFLASTLGSYGIEAQHPDEFIADWIDLKPLATVQAVRVIQTRLKNPPLQRDEYLKILLKQGLPTSVAMLRQLENEQS